VPTHAELVNQGIDAANFAQTQINTSAGISNANPASGILQ